MGICENCNTDHAEEYKKQLPELYLLDKAFTAVQESGDEIFSDAVQQFAFRTVKDNCDEFIEARIREGHNTKDAVEQFAANMMLAAFAIGVGVSFDYRENMPTVVRDYNEQDAYVEKHLAALAEAEKMREQMREQMAGGIDKDAMVQVLKDAGLIPKDFDGDVQIAAFEIPNGGDDEGPATGMYL